MKLRTPLPGGITRWAHLTWSSHQLRHFRDVELEGKNRRSELELLRDQDRHRLSELLTPRTRREPPMPPALIYDRDGQQFFRCAWCQTERLVREFRALRVQVGHRTCLLVCEDGNPTPDGGVIDAKCGDELRAALPALVELAGQAALARAQRDESASADTERSPSASAIEDDDPSEGDTVFIEEPSEPSPSSTPPSE